MDWSLPGLFGLFLLPAFAAHHPPAPAAADGVTASCEDFVRVTDAGIHRPDRRLVCARGARYYLGGETFGPNALSIGGVDPAAYLASHCKGSGHP